MSYHVNPETGKVGKCSATIQCQFAEDGEIPEHYSTAEKAQKAYEEANEKEIFVTLEKEWAKFEENTEIEENEQKIRDYEKQLNDANSEMLHLQAAAYKCNDKIAAFDHANGQNSYFNQFENTLQNTLGIMYNKSIAIQGQFTKEEAVFAKYIYREASMVANFNLYDYYNKKTADLLVDGPLRAPKTSALKSNKKVNKEYDEYEEKRDALRKGKEKLSYFENVIKHDFAAEFRNNAELVVFHSKIREQFPDTYDHFVKTRLIREPSTYESAPFEEENKSGTTNDSIKVKEKELKADNDRVAYMASKLNDYCSYMPDYYSENDVNEFLDYETDIKRSLASLSEKSYKMHESFSHEDCTYARNLFRESTILANLKIHEYYDNKIDAIKSRIIKPDKKLFKTTKHREAVQEYERKLGILSEAKKKREEAEDAVTYHIQKMDYDEFVNEREFKKIHNSIQEKDWYNYSRFIEEGYIEKPFDPDYEDDDDYNNELPF